MDQSFYLVRSMIDDKIHNELHVAPCELTDQTIDILHCTVWTMDAAVV
jgi:hypothetical protein